MPDHNQFEAQVPLRVNRLNHPAPLRAEYFEGDAITSGAVIYNTQSAVVAINNFKPAHAVLAGPMDGIPSVGVGGRSDQSSNVGIYGYSKDGTGVYCISENFEALHAETSSMETAAIAAIQKNADSPTAALFARHNGHGAAAVLEGDVFISGNLVVQGNGYMTLSKRVEHLESSLQICLNQIGNLEINLQHYMTRLQALEATVQAMR